MFQWWSMLTKPQNALLALAAVFFTFAGLFHFLKPGPYMRIMPPYIPWPLAMVYISGAAEMAGGLGLLVPPVRRMAAWGLVALLIAVFPANIYMASNPVQAGASSLPPAALWGRLLLQPIFIGWVLWCTKPARRTF